MTDSGKWCMAGQHWLPLEAFAPNEQLNSGLDSWCRECRRERARQWRAENPDYIREYNERRRAEYWAEHPVPTRACVVCGEPHSRQPRALVCSERCRNERKREQRRKAAAALKALSALDFPGRLGPGEEERRPRRATLERSSAGRLEHDNLVLAEVTAQ
jgi:predicted nucleic acid-binding Zn ribbon protein